MIRLTRSQVQPIGLDLGADSIKMLQLEVVGDSLAVVAASKRAAPQEEGDAKDRAAAMGECIRQMLRQGSFIGRRVVAALPREIVHSKNLRLPQMPPAEVDQAVEFEAPNLFPFDVEEAVVHHIAAGEVRQGTEVKQEVIVLAARHADIDLYIEQLHGAGLVVDSLDLEATALYRTVDRFVRRKEDEHVVHVLVDVGYRRSQVVIGRGREINFIKPIELGGQHLTESVSRKLGITIGEARALRRRLSETPVDEAERQRDPVRQAVFDATRSVVDELARELSLCLRYYSVAFRGHRPSRVRVLGGEACDPQVLAQLGADLPIPVEVGRPLLSVDISRMKPADRRGPLSEWSLALGLGLRRTRGAFGPRDGAPRDPFARPDGAPTAEVIDLGKVVGQAASPAPAASTPAAPASPAPAAPALAAAAATEADHA